MSSEKASARRTALFYLLLAAACALFSTSCTSCRKGRQTATQGAPIPTPPSRAIYVTNNGSDSVSVIDRDGDLVTTVSVDLDPDAHEAPHHLAADTRRGAVFVALAFPPDEQPKKKKDPHGAHGSGAEPGRLARLDARTLAVEKTTPVAENPGDVVLTPDRSRLLVTHYDMRRAMRVAERGAGSPATMFAELQVFSADTLEKVASRPLCVAPHGIAVTRDGKRALVACYGSDELAVTRLDEPSLPTARFPLGAAQGVPGVPRYGPYSATLSPDEREVIVATLEGADVRVFDLGEGRFLPERTVSLGARVMMPAFTADGALLAPLQSPDGLVRLDLATRKVTARALLGDHCKLPHAAKVAPGGRAFVVCEGDHKSPGTVVEVDPATLTLRRTWTVGVYPDGLDFGD